MEETEIKSKQELKYLAVTLGRKVLWKKHREESLQKTTMGLMIA